jgi:hypothetical protein
MSIARALDEPFFQRKRGFNAAFAAVPLSEFLEITRHIAGIVGVDTKVDCVRMLVDVDSLNVSFKKAKEYVGSEPLHTQQRRRCCGDRVIRGLSGRDKLR